MTAQNSDRNCRELTELCPVSKKHAGLSNSAGIANIDGATKRNHSHPTLRKKILEQ